MLLLRACPCSLRSVLGSFAVLLGACADPCLDDGLLQKDRGGECPPLQGATDSAGESASGTDTHSASGSAEASQSGTADASGGSQSGTGGDGTMDDGASMDAGSIDDDGATSGPTPDYCDNGVQDGDESDVDCGGSCDGCDDGETCFVSPDCKSEQCTPDMTCGADNWCVELIDDNGCQNCIKTSCCESVQACIANDPKCACWVDCIEKTNDFKPCEELCMVQGKPGAITSCANSQCKFAGACDG